MKLISFAFIALFIVSPTAFAATPDTSASCTKDLTQEVRGFKRAMALKVGEEVLVVDQIDSRFQKIYKLKIEAITRDYKFIFTINEKKRIIDWTHIGLAATFSGATANQPFVSNDENATVGTYLGYMLDENRVIVTYEDGERALMNASLVALSSIVVLQPPGPGEPTTTIDKGVFPREVYFAEVMGGLYGDITAVPATLQSIVNNKATLIVRGRTVQDVALNLIADAAKSFKRDQRVVIENDELGIEFGTIVGQFPNGDLVFIGEDSAQNIQVVKPTQVSKLRQLDPPKPQAAQAPAFSFSGEHEFYLSGIGMNSVFADNINFGRLNKLIISETREGFEIHIGAYIYMSGANGIEISPPNATNFGVTRANATTLVIKVNAHQSISFVARKVNDANGSHIEIDVYNSFADYEPTLDAVYTSNRL